jgi:PAS domain S-box-containing protein
MATRGLEEMVGCSRQIIDSVQEGVVVYGPDATCRLWNPYMEQLSGEPAASVLGRRIVEVFPFLRATGIEGAIEQALRGDMPPPAVFPFRHPSTGRSGWVSDMHSPLRNAAGEVVGVVGIVRDITDQKRIEDVQRFLSECGWAASGEDFFSSLARFLAETLQMDFVCIDRLVGEGRSARTVAVYYDGRFEDNIEYALDDTPCGSVVGEAVCCFPRGVRRRFPRDQVLQEMSAESYVGTTLWSSTGQPIGLIAVIGRSPLEDPRLAELVLKMVTVRAAGELERRQAEEALREAQATLEQRVAERTRELSDANARLRREMVEREQLEQQLLEVKRLESIGQLAGGVAHEVRNPLNAILSLTEALFREKEVEGNPEFEPYLGHIRSQVMRLSSLMKDLLDLGKPLNATGLETVPLHDLCRESLALWQDSGMAANRTAVLLVDEGAGGLRVRGDRIKLQQVFFNLLENAGFHCPPGLGIILRLLAPEAEGPSAAMARVRIADQGVGIPPEQLPRVFEPFFSDRKGGTGLGLALVRHFVKSMGGRCGYGTTILPPAVRRRSPSPLPGRMNHEADGPAGGG